MLGDNSKAHKDNINNQIDYNEYNRLNNLLNIQLEEWEKNQTAINEIVNKNNLLS